MLGRPYRLLAAPVYRLQSVSRAGACSSHRAGAFNLGPSLLFLIGVGLIYGRCRGNAETWPTVPPAGRSRPGMNLMLLEDRRFRYWPLIAFPDPRSRGQMWPGASGCRRPIRQPRLRGSDAGADDQVGVYVLLRPCGCCLFVRRVQNRECRFEGAVLGGMFHAVFGAVRHALAPISTGRLAGYVRQSYSSGHVARGCWPGTSRKLWPPGLYTPVSSTLGGAAYKWLLIPPEKLLERSR